MPSFGESLKAARAKAKKTLRETSDLSGLSVSHLSDIEQGRKRPPEREVVIRIEEFLGVTGNELVTLAEVERDKMPTQMLQSLQAKPKLNDLFFRLKNLPDDELDEFIRSLPQNDSDPKS